MSDTPIIPQDMPAEEALLGACLANESALDVIADLIESTDFFRASHGKLYETMQRMRAAGEPIDRITVGRHFPQELRERLVAYEEALPTASNVRQYARQVLDKSRLRALTIAGNRIAELGYQSADVDAACTEAERVAFEALTGRSAREPIEIVDVLKNAEQELRERAAGKTPHDRLSSGVGIIDSLGGLERSGLHILAARPGVGKTALALRIAAHVARHSGPVLFASLEMTAAALAARLIASECSIGRDAMRSGELYDSQRAALLALILAFEQATLRIADAPRMSIADVRRHARRLHTRSAVALVVVDYVQLLHVPRRRREQTREREVAESSAALKALARELDAPVLALSQLNRSLEQRGEESEPRLSDLRESGSLEQDADMVVFLWPDAKRQKELGRPRGHALQRIAVKIAKHRSGPTGVGALEFHRATTGFEEIRA